MKSSRPLIASDDAELSVEEGLGHSEMNQPGLSPPKTAAPRRRCRCPPATGCFRPDSSPIRGRPHRGGRAASRDRRKGETDVVGVGNALAPAADRIAGGFRGVVAEQSEAVFVPDPVAIAAQFPVSESACSNGGPLPCAIWVEQPPDRTRRGRQHPGLDLGLGILGRGGAGVGNPRSEQRSHQYGCQCRPHQPPHRSRHLPESAPELTDLLQRLAFGLRHLRDDEEQGEHAEAGIGEKRGGGTASAGFRA